MLAYGHELPARCRPHKLVGNYAGCWECHIDPDWLLIYQYENTTLKLLRTGTHADLFD
jgi:mRNA interferase YafQ